VSLPLRAYWIVEILENKQFSTRKTTTANHLPAMSGGERWRSRLW
jgi:hypothetical protein